MISHSLNTNEAKKHFNSMLNLLKNSTKCMDIIAVKGVKNVLEHFAESEGPDGRWVPDKPSTLRARAHRSNKSGRAKSSSIMPLVDTGLMRNSLRGIGTERDAILTVRCSYADYHNQTSGPTGGKIPQRKFLWIDNKTLNNMCVTYLRYLVG